MAQALPASRRTGSHAALDSILPPPPSPEEPEFAEWVTQHHRYSVETRATAEAAIEASQRIEKAIGVEPQPAQGIEGSGLLKVLAGHVKSREVDERRRADIRLVVGTAVSVIAAIGAFVGLLKAIGWLH